MVPPILSLNRKIKQNVKVLFSDHPKTTEGYGFYNLLGAGAWGETSARCSKEKCPFKYKIVIMLLHIHKFLLRAYHSMQSTLPCHHRSRGGGGITATVGGENSELVSGWKKPQWMNSIVLLFRWRLFLKASLETHHMLLSERPGYRKCDNLTSHVRLSRFIWGI